VGKNEQKEGVLMKEWEEKGMFNKTRKYVANPNKALNDFVKQHTIEFLVPFQVDKGTHWSGDQIRIRKADYDKLKKETQDILKKYATVPKDSNGVYKDDPHAKELYETTWYWERCDAYVFAYELDAYWIQYKGTWGYEGMEDGTTMEFVRYDQYPQIIMKNLNCYENGEANKKFQENICL